MPGGGDSSSFAGGHTAAAGSAVARGWLQLRQHDCFQPETAAARPVDGTSPVGTGARHDGTADGQVAALPDQRLAKKSSGPPRYVTPRWDWPLTVSSQPTCRIGCTRPTSAGPKPAVWVPILQPSLFWLRCRPRIALSLSPCRSPV